MLTIKEIAESIKNRSTVLFLGPHLVTFPDHEGKERGLQAHLAYFLTKEVERQLDKKLDWADAYELAYVKQRLDEDFRDRLPETFLKNKIEAFYQQYEQNIPDVYKVIADLPFMYIVSTTPDRLLEKALIDNGKTLASKHFFYYHYRHDEHNNKQAANLNLEKINVQKPLIYNLLGSWADELNSAVITQEDQLNFVEKILQTEHKSAGIPKEIAMAFFGRAQQSNYVFAGFDFNDWQLKIILYVIRRFRLQTNERFLGATIALQNPESLQVAQQDFLKEFFNVRFINEHNANFFKSIQDALKSNDEANKAKALPKFYIVSDDEDHALMQDLKRLLKAYSIDIVDAPQAGEDIETFRQTQLTSADAIVFLLTANFLDNDTFMDMFYKAFETRQRRYLLGIVMSACDWVSVPELEEMTVIDKSDLGDDFPEFLKQLNAAKK